MVHPYTLDGDEAPSEGVYSAIAEVENCSPLDFRQLAEVIDPDALDSILSENTEMAEVSFEYCGYRVTATSAEIIVEESK